MPPFGKTVANSIFYENEVPKKASAPANIKLSEGKLTKKVKQRENSTRIRRHLKNRAASEFNPTMKYTIVVTIMVGMSRKGIRSKRTLDKSHAKGLCEGAMLRNISISPAMLFTNE